MDGRLAWVLDAVRLRWLVYSKKLARSVGLFFLVQLGKDIFNFLRWVV
mgnify:CR=1 FL=1